jgi:hypothetical protein
MRQFLLEKTFLDYSWLRHLFSTVWTSDWFSLLSKDGLTLCFHGIYDHFSITASKGS